jgi:hypothetical protein
MSKERPNPPGILADDVSSSRNGSAKAIRRVSKMIWWSLPRIGVDCQNISPFEPTIWIAPFSVY